MILKNSMRMWPCLRTGFRRSPFPRLPPWLGSLKESEVKGPNCSWLVPELCSKKIPRLYLLFESSGKNRGSHQMVVEIRTLKDNSMIMFHCQYTISFLLFCFFFFPDVCQLLKNNGSHLLIDISLCSCKNLNKIMWNSYLKIHIFPLKLGTNCAFVC